MTLTAVHEAIFRKKGRAAATTEKPGGSRLRIQKAQGNATGKLYVTLSRADCRLVRPCRLDLSYAPSNAAILPKCALRIVPTDRAIDRQIKRTIVANSAHSTAIGGRSRKINRQIRRRKDLPFAMCPLMLEMRQ
jgi:hypothetical protein